MSANNYRNFTAAAQVINKRLCYATSKGNMLQGLNYEKAGTQNLKGEDNLPSLTPWTIANVENIFQGGRLPKNDPNSTLNAQNTAVGSVQTLVYRLVTSRRSGWFPTGQDTHKGLLDWIALIQDAIETNNNENLAEADATLEETLCKPVRFSIQETETSELSYTVFLELELHLMPTCRVKRSLHLPESQ